MAKLLGNNYRLWIEGSTPGTLAEIKGQTSMSVGRQGQTIDTSSKDDFPYGTSAPGLRTLTIDVEIIPNLPDTTGFTVFETAANSATGAAKKFEIRKGGSAGTSSDKVFAASMYITNYNTSFGQNDSVKVTAQLVLESAPTTDVLA